MECIKQDGQAKQTRINYLFKSDSQGSDYSVTVRPLPHITFAAKTLVPENPQEFISCQLKETIEPWCTNHIGVINRLFPDMNNGHRIRMLTSENKIKAQELYFPYPEDLSYLYAAKGEKWPDTLKNGFQSAITQGLNFEQPIDMTRQEINYCDLAKPLDNQGLAAILNQPDNEVLMQINSARQLIESSEPFIDTNRFHQEIMYRAWYELQQNDDIFHGYLIEQSRFVVFMFSHPEAFSWKIAFKKFGTESNITDEIDIVQVSSEILCGIYRAKENELDSSLYQIEVLSSDASFEKSWGKQWKKTKSYTLIEKLRFDISNLAGEFAIINCDPISVEEGLFKQHNSQFAHLLKAAVTQDKTTSKKDSGLATIAHEIKINKTRMDYLRGILNIDGQRKGMKLLGQAISEALKASKEINLSTIKSIDLAFNINEYRYEMFDNLKDTYKQLKSEINFAGGTLDELLSDSDTVLKQIWTKTAPSSDPAQQQADFRKTFAGYVTSKFNLPEAHIQRTLQRVDFISNRVGTTLNIYDTVQMADKYFYEAINNLDNKLQQHHEVFLDYHQQISQWNDNKDPSLGSTFRPDEQGELSLTILFDFDQSEVHDKAISLSKSPQLNPGNNGGNTGQVSSSQSFSESAALNEIARLMNDHPEIELLLHGHTDPIGDNQYNLKLSIRRAATVRDILVTRYGIADSRIQVIGLGENCPIYNEQGDVDYAACRRVEAVIQYLGTYHYLPSREGINSLEQARHATVLAKQGHDQQLADLAGKAWDWIMMVGAAHPYVRLLSAIIVTYDIVKNALALVDELAFDHFFQTEIAQYQQLKSYHSSANANQILLRDSFEREQDDANMIYLQTQFRVRAEALNGLMGLITRAAIGATDIDDYLLRFETYQIPAYIENFLLNDGWKFNLQPNFPLTMDEYWTYAVNSAGLISEEHYSWFGFDKDFRLTNTPHKATLTFVETLKLALYNQINVRDNIIDALLNAYETAQHAYSRVTNTTPQFERADFQRCFPIHHLSSDNFSSLAKHFISNFDFLGDDIYEHTAIYARDKTSKDVNDWQLLDTWRQRSGKSRPLSPLDQIRILVILKDSLSEQHNTFPASIQLIRTDGLDKIDGPVYKTLMRPLVDSELLAQEKHYIGRIGCIVHPVYQFGQVTFNGTKPFTTEFRLSFNSRPYALPEAFKHSEGFEQAWDYWRSGGLDDMCYQFQVRIANSHSTQHTIRVTGSEEEPDGEYEVTVRAREMLPRQPRRKKIGRVRHKIRYRWLDDAIFLYAPFLKSRTSKLDYPALLGDNHYLMVLIRVGGEQGQYLAPNSVFEDDINHSQNQQYGMSLKDSSTLDFSRFDWDTSIEFMFIASAANVNLKAYEMAKMPWTKVPFSTRLVETTGRNTNGPKIQTTLSYLGKLKKQSNLFSSSYQFEMDKHSSTRERFHPIIDLLNTPGDKANNIGGSYGDLFKDDERFIYAGYYRCHYENLMGQKIASIRPFGSNKNFSSDRVSLEPKLRHNPRMKKNMPVHPPFQYAFEEAQSTGQTLDSDWTEFHFNAPDSYFEDVPWLREPDNKADLLAHAQQHKKDTLLLEWSQKSDDEKKRRIKHWIEQDTQSIKQIGVKAIQR